MLALFTHQITHNDAFYNTKLLVRFHIINVQPTCKVQLISLSLKNIRYYRLMITRDRIHEVIQMSVGLIQYSNLIPGALMNTAAMSKTPR